MITIYTECKKLTDGSEVYATIIQSQDGDYDDATIKLDNVLFTDLQADRFAIKLAELLDQYTTDDVQLADQFITTHE